MTPIVRIVEAQLGQSAPTRLVVSGLDDPDGFRAAWAPSGASIERVGDRLHAMSTARALTRAAGRGLPGPEASALIENVQAAIDAWTGPTPSWHVRDRELGFGDGPLLMGVLNVTPDSFSDGGRLYPDDHPRAGRDAARRMVYDGAAIIDIGGESTRPGSAAVAVEEELRRVLPAVEALRDDDVPISVDTRKPAVARRAVQAGAAIVNDVSGGHNDELLSVVAETGAGYVLMHTRGTPADMQEHADYTDVVAEVYEHLAVGIHRCLAAGIAADRIAVDPGIGFAKTVEHNLTLLGALRQFRSLGRPVLVGVSRKSFIGTVLGQADPSQRLEGGLACAALACHAGAGVIRVHDVAPTARVTRMVTAITAATV